MSNDQNLGEVTYTRTYDAPRDLVFECMITPEHLTHFWGPVGVSTPIGNIKVDPRPGGVFETIMVNDATGEEYPTRGVFVEVTKPEKIVWTEPDVEGGMTTTSTFQRPRRRPHRGRRPPDQRARDVPYSGLSGRDAEQLRPLRRVPGDAEVAPNHDLSGARQESGPAESRVPCCDDTAGGHHDGGAAANPFGPSIDHGLYGEMVATTTRWRGSIGGLPIRNLLSFQYGSRYSLNGGALHCENMRAGCTR